MAAPTTAALREETSCQPGAVHTWRKETYGREAVGLFLTHSGLAAGKDDAAQQRIGHELWNIPPLCRHHTGLMPANLITLPHFSVSFPMNLPKSAGELANTVYPMSASRLFILGSVRPSLISLLSLSTISTGVSLGAPTPFHVVASYPSTKSPTVGTSGSASERIAVVTANARSLPALTYSIDDISANITCTC